MNREREIANKTYVESPEVKEVSNQVLAKDTSVFIDNARIGYLLVYPNISKTVAGRCIKASKEVKFFSDYDYLIQMSGELWDSLDDNLQYILTLHELLHIHVDYDKEGEPVYKLRDHDVKDFSCIINEYGLDWLNALRESMVSIEDSEGKGVIKPSDVKL